MTNAKKFKDVFNIAPDINMWPLECPKDLEKCMWRDNGECHCEDWWIAEYQEQEEKKQ